MPSNLKEIFKQRLKYPKIRIKCGFALSQQLWMEKWRKQALAWLLAPFD